MLTKILYLFRLLRFQGVSPKFCKVLDGPATSFTEWVKENKSLFSTDIRAAWGLVLEHELFREGMVEFEDTMGRFHRFVEYYEQGVEFGEARFVKQLRTTLSRPS